MVRALRVGVPGGMVGGALMALWSMVAMWMTGLGFWTPLNLIAHTFYKSAPLDGTFSGLALLIGLGVHMTVASVFGVVITLLALWLPGRRSVVIAAGILFVAVVWPVMQWGVWYKLDEDAAEGFTDWIFAFAHLVFAVTAAGMASIGVADDENARRGRHAAGRTPPPVTPPPGSLFQPDRRQQSLWNDPPIRAVPSSRGGAWASGELGPGPGAIERRGGPTRGRPRRPE
jgi:hypothetical protein